MDNRTLQSRLLSLTAPALVALLLAPAIAQAQTVITINPPKPSAAEAEREQEWRRAFIAAEERYRKTHKSILLTVDYVDVPLPDLLKASQWIASGQQHYALLLAALVKGGARDVKGAQVQAWDREMRENSTIVPVIIPGEEQAPPRDMTSYTEATPRFNADGTITVLIRLELGQVDAIPLPSSAPGYQCANPTFHDGETAEIGNSVMRSATGASLAHLTFVRVETSTNNGTDLEPALNRPPTDSVIVTP